MSEPTLLERIAGGDRDAVRSCIARYGPLVWSVTRRLLTNDADAEECVQDVFLDLWRSASRFDASRGTEATFVAMLARRRVVDRLRALGREPAVDADEDVEAILAAPPSATDAPLAARARQAFAELEPERRGVLHLAVHRGFTQSEIAERTGLPLGTIKSHLRRGLATLRAKVDRPRGHE